MTTGEILARIKSSGVSLRPVGDRIIADSNNPLTERQRQFIRQYKGAILKALATNSAVSTDPVSHAHVESSQAVTEPLPTRIDAQEPEPKERLCSQCAHFDRSPYGYPLGLCQQYGDKEEHPNGRIQHATSRPAQFGCGDFVLRPPADDSKTCLACRHYSQQSTMCSVVNTGCPYPAIPPCRGESFDPYEVLQ